MQAPPDLPLVSPPVNIRESVTRAIVRQRRPDFESAEIRRAPGIIVIDVRQHDAAIDGSRPGFQRKIEIVRIEEILYARVVTRIAHRHVLEDRIIDYDAVLVLAGGLAIGCARLSRPIRPIRAGRRRKAIC